MNIVPAFKKFAKQRGRELEDLLQAEWTPESAQLQVAGQQVRFKANVERDAAWQLYVELNTRIATQELQSGGGALREALESLYSVFSVTRDILKSAGPIVGRGNQSLGFYSMEILNNVLRPVLARWHPMLTSWEEKRASGISRFDHERAWSKACELRKELERTRKLLLEYAEALAVLAGVSGGTTSR